MENLGVLIVFALIGLAQWLFRMLRDRAQSQTPPPVEMRPAPPPAPAPRPYVAPEPVSVEPVAAEVLFARRQMPYVPPPPPRPVMTRAPLASRAELRRAIVLMEILGPCRGVEPMARPRGD